MNDACVYDFETLGQNPRSAPVVSLAVLNFSRDRFRINAYTYRELLDAVSVIKFNVEDQVMNHGKKIEPDTLRWWGKQSKAAQKQLAPTPWDQPISDLPSWFIENTQSPKATYTRNNTFDPIFLDQLMKDVGSCLPYDWWTIRDTKSTIDGMAWGHDVQDNFIPDGLESHFVAHDPAHDVAMDVMRLQFLARAIG